MTKEEIRIQTIAQLERISGMLGSMGEEKDWTEYAIRALEQEPILDKIRAEIIEMTSNRGFLSCETSAIHKDINAVFDKYKEDRSEE